jgi:cell wall-associated NlpC family hydrolase
MRTVTRRGLLAGAMTVLTYAGSQSAFAKDKSEHETLILDVPELNALPEQLSTNAFTTEGTGTAGSGQAIVDFAMGYLGYPYAAGGNSPAGFDCSGFVQFVILNTLGIDIGHAVEGQPYAGTAVAGDALQPGDIVFFQNTYREGISHASIYIGDGQIIHAENYGTGVTISWVWSDYYGPRYWGAIRLT